MYGSVLIILFHFYFDHLESKAPPPSNPKLEQIIRDNRNESEINWGGKRLNDDDMATVAYYLLKDNQVSCSLKIKFKHVITPSTLRKASLRNLLISCEWIGD